MKDIRFLYSSMSVILQLFDNTFLQIFSQICSYFFSCTFRSNLGHVTVYHEVD